MNSLVKFIAVSCLYSACAEWRELSLILFCFMATDSVTDTFTISVNNTNKEEKFAEIKIIFKKPKTKTVTWVCSLETSQHIRLYTG
jgi:hypothetical protein